MSKADKQSILQSLSSCEYGSHRFVDHSWDLGSFSIYFSKRSGGQLFKDLNIRVSYEPKKYHFAHNSKVLYSSSSLEAVLSKVREFEGDPYATPLL